MWHYSVAYGQDWFGRDLTIPLVCVCCVCPLPLYFILRLKSPWSGDHLCVLLFHSLGESDRNPFCITKMKSPTGFLSCKNIGSKCKGICNQKGFLLEKPTEQRHGYGSLKHIYFFIKFICIRMVPLITKLLHFFFLYTQCLRTSLWINEISTPLIASSTVQTLVWSSWVIFWCQSETTELSQETDIPCTAFNWEQSLVSLPHGMARVKFKINGFFYPNLDFSVGFFWDCICHQNVILCVHSTAVLFLTLHTSKH